MTQQTEDLIIKFVVSICVTTVLNAWYVLFVILNR